MIYNIFNTYQESYEAVIYDFMCFMEALNDDNGYTGVMLGLDNYKMLREWFIEYKDGITTKKEVLEKYNSVKDSLPKGRWADIITITVNEDFTYNPDGNIYYIYPICPYSDRSYQTRELGQEAFPPVEFT